MVRIGLVGVGFMGWIHYLAYRKSKQAKLVAFASRDPAKQRGNWRGIKGNFGPPGEEIDVSGMAVYDDLSAMLKDPSIDMVDICLPPHLHVEAVKASLAAGKHVLCEKPLALHAADALRLVAFSNRTGKKLMVAQVLPFIPEFAFLVDATRQGRYGKLLGGRFRRVIGPPDWIPDFYDPTRVGGPLVDLHIHDAHLIRLLFGMPHRVTSRGRMNGHEPQYFESLFEMADPGQVVSATCGVTDSPGRSFTHGYEVHFEQATLQFEWIGLSDAPVAVPLMVLHRDGRIERPSLGSGDPVDAFVIECDAAARSAAGEPMNEALDGRLAADALVICAAQAKSIRDRSTESID
jgi:predicted dehydrogenase